LRLQHIDNDPCLQCALLLHVDDEGDDTAAAGSQGDQDLGGSLGGEAGPKVKKGRRGPAQPDLDPSATLADPEALKDKKGDNTFESDPLFNRTTKLFDENSASGGCHQQLCGPPGWVCAWLAEVRLMNADVHAVPATLVMLQIVSACCC
jgi:hypothetical protein